jgi:predicted esterase
MAQLIVLHGYTMNAAVMREGLAGLAERLEREIELVFVDAPHTCSAAAVDHFYSSWKAPRLVPPHLTWWDSTEDGREYRGWEETRERMHAAMAGSQVVGLLGFSQGAILSCAITALAEQGEMPQVRFAILVAGRTPRAEVLQPALARPLRTPSLHVWGANDAMAAASPELSGRFDPATREVVVWDGGHRVPTRGTGADEIVRFVQKRREELAGA